MDYDALESIFYYTYLHNHNYPEFQMWGLYNTALCVLHTCMKGIATPTPTAADPLHIGSVCRTVYNDNTKSALRLIPWVSVVSSPSPPPGTKLEVYEPVQLVLYCREKFSEEYDTRHLHSRHGDGMPTECSSARLKVRSAM